MQVPVFEPGHVRATAGLCGCSSREEATSMLQVFEGEYMIAELHVLAIIVHENWCYQV